jgi:hypothetical protein
MDPLLVRLVIDLYIFSFTFWRFFAVVSLYVVDMIAYYNNTLFVYLSLYIKTDSDTDTQIM